MMWVCDLWGLWVGSMVVMWVWWVYDLILGGGGFNLMGLWMVVMVVLGCYFVLGLVGSKQAINASASHSKSSTQLENPYIYSHH